MDLKGLGIFLGLSYVLGYALTLGGAYVGLLSFESGSILHSMLMVVLFNLPALFAFVAGQAGQGPVLTRVMPIPRVDVLRATVVMVLVFVAYNLVNCALGFSTLDWRLGTLINILQQNAQTPLSPGALAILPAFLIVAGILLSMVMGATLVAVCVLGHVYAWQAFLGDRLAPLGRPRATILGGVLWALWFAPFVYLHFHTTNVMESPSPLRAIGFVPIGGVLVAIGLNAVIRRAYERTQALALPAVILGAFIANIMTGVFSIWGYLFQIPVPPFAGVLGVTSAVFWVLLALYPGVIAGGKVNPPDSAA